jgi:hypothetical protein
VTAFIIPDDDSSRIITFDVIESENHESIAEITDHPVEVGVSISDHIRPLPARLSLVAYTTNQPITVNPFTQRGEVKSFKFEVPKYSIPVEPTPGALYRAGIQALGSLFGDSDRSVSILAFDSPFNAIWETYEVLREFQENGMLLQILTGIRSYEDMVIERVAAPRTAGDSGVAFAIDVRQLRVVSSGQVAAPPVPADDVPGGSPLANKGGQGAKPPSPGEDEGKGGSIAFKFLSGQGLL